MGSRAFKLGALVGAIVFGGGAALLERQLDGVREQVQSDTVPSALLDYGTLGRILREGELITAIPNDGVRFPIDDRALDEEPVLFRRKGVVGYDLYRANPSALPGPLDPTLPAELTDRGDWMVLSIAIAPEDLHGEERGLLTHREERLERRAVAALYRGGEVLFQSRVGLKLHGGRSRSEDRQHSYRLQLRPRHGALELPRGLLFGGVRDPISTLVVRRTEGFTTCVAYDIAAELGCDVPQTEPALLYVNGVGEGVFVLTEHISRRQYNDRLGHSDFYLHRRRGLTDKASLNAINRLQRWARDLQGHATAAEAERYVDLDGLLPYWLTVAFCGTSDWEQGAAFLDLTDPDARWTWKPWDLDRSFSSAVHSSLGLRAWEIPSIDLFIGDPEQAHATVPAMLGRNLLTDDLEFRARFIRYVRDGINHRLTPKVLARIQAAYSGRMSDLGAPDSKEFTNRDRFLAARRLVVLEHLRRQFDLPELVTLTVQATEPCSIMVDGHEYLTPWSGWYFSGDPVRLAVPDAAAARLRFWRVAGERRPGREVEVEVVGDMTVNAVLR